MGKAYIGVNNIPKNISKIYVGDENGIARLVKKGYVGVDGKAKLFWDEIQEPVFLNYIESTGTQYINTGVNLTSSHNIVFDGYANEGGGPICGVIATNGDYRLNHLGGFSGDASYKYRLVRRYKDGISDGYVFSNSTYTSNVRHVIRTDANKLYVDEALAGTVTSYEVNCDIPLYLFAVNKYSTIYAEGSIRLYSFKIYDGSTLIRDFRPYKDANGVICLYDLVEGKCYYNQGTGSFAGGEEINTDQVVNYLMLYDGSLGEAGENGANVCADVTDGFSKMVASGSATLTYNANNVYFANVGTGTNNTAFMTNNSIDMTEYSLVCGKSLPNTSNYISSVLGVRNKKGYGGAGESGSAGISSNTNNSGVVSDGANSNFIGKLFMYDSNISSITNGYPYFADYSSGTASMTIYSMFLVKQDNWQELCSIAGLNSSDYASEETLCANSTAITQILSNASAVDFMLKQCTGTFMYYFIRSSTCLTALNNSTNKTKIHANEHWSKFLNMVA